MNMINFLTKKKVQSAQKVQKCDEGALWWENKDIKKGKSKALFFKYKKPLFKWLSPWRKV